MVTTSRFFAVCLIASGISAAYAADVRLKAGMPIYKMRPPLGALEIMLTMPLALEFYPIVCSIWGRPHTISTKVSLGKSVLMTRAMHLDLMSPLRLSGREGFPRNE